MKTISVHDKKLNKGDKILRRKKSGEPFVDEVIWAGEPVKQINNIWTIDIGSKLFPLSTKNFCKDIEILVK